MLRRRLKKHSTLSVLFALGCSGGRPAFFSSTPCFQSLLQGLPCETSDATQIPNEIKILIGWSNVHGLTTPHIRFCPLPFKSTIQSAEVDPGLSGHLYPQGTYKVFGQANIVVQISKITLLQWKW